MKTTVLRTGLLYVAWIAVFALDRLAFCCLCGVDFGEVFFHSLAMDAAVAGYLTALPVLVESVAVWAGWRRWMRVLLLGYGALVSAVLAVIFALDLGLYGAWGFRLDTTPIFYFMSSPGAAMASVTGWQMVVGVLAIVVVGIGLFLMFRAIVTAWRVFTIRNRVAATIVSVVILGLLFVGIRGGFGPSTMNLSRAYFSSDAKKNHAAVNPAFSLLYSATHKGDFARMHRYFEPEELGGIVAPMLSRGEAVMDTTVSLRTGRPDIYLVIMESFSSHILPMYGGEPIAMRLDSIGRSGLVFSRFYAPGFRTDRAIPAILSGFPPLPDISIMKYADKGERLPSLARELERQGGYSTTYYYGGDIGFTNMGAFLQGAGVERIISENDFPLGRRLSKWGVYDGDLFDYVAEQEANRGGASRPRFVVIQSSSSHEPFDVPYESRRYPGNERVASLEYADSCLGVLYERITAANPNALFVITGDHYGTWPMREDLPTIAEQHSVPLVVAGPALEGGGAIDRPGSHVDVAATVMGLLGMKGDAFPFSRDLLSDTTSTPIWLAPRMGGVMLDSDGRTGSVNADTGAEEGDADLSRLARGWLQYLCQYISQL